MTQDRYIDKSGDKKYFTQIPNMIVNHSAAYEQSLYLIMKRLAGEGGSCYASLNFLAKKMKVDKKTVAKTITKLLKRKWIKETDKTKVKGGYVRTFIIIDIWKLNMANYEGGVQVPTSISGSVEEGGGRQILGSGRHKDTSKNSNNIYNKNSSFKKYKKPYFRGNPMRNSFGKWYVIENGEWLEFAGQQKDIEFK